MASPTTTVTIAGLTGKLALLITKYLLKTPGVHINGRCRDPSKLPSAIAANPRITTFQATATDADQIRRALKNASVAICCYLGDPGLMVSGQKALIDACIAEKVPRYIASDWSLDSTRLQFGDLPPKDPMKHIVAYLDERKDQIKGVHVLNGCFLEAPWRSIWNAQGQNFMYWGTGEEKWDLTSYGNAAEYTAKVALDAEADGYLYFRGDHVSVKDIAATYKEVYGKEPIVKRMGSLEDLYKTMHQVKQQNPGNIWAWMGMFYTYYCTDNSLTKMREPLDNDRYPGVKLVTVRDYFEKFPIESLGKMLPYEDSA